MARGERPIGVFDSGVGGLSVLRHVRAMLPGEDLLYVADSAHAPYGDKSVQFIEARAMAIAEFLVARDAKALVVACNTATAVALDALVPASGLELPPSWPVPTPPRLASEPSWLAPAPSWFAPAPSWFAPAPS